MTPLTAPTPCLETEESPEPPPSTLCLASQSRQPCRRLRLLRHSSPVCTRTPAAHCTARMSRSAQESSACQGCRRGAVGVQMGATGARRVRERRRATASRRMRMDATATSGCSMTSALRMLLRRDTGRFSEGTATKVVEEMDIHLVMSCTKTVGTNSLRKEHSNGRTQYNNLHHLSLRFSKNLLVRLVMLGKLDITVFSGFGAPVVSYAPWPMLFNPALRQS